MYIGIGLNGASSEREPEKAGERVTFHCLLDFSLHMPDVGGRNE